MPCPKSATVVDRRVDANVSVDCMTGVGIGGIAAEFQCQMVVDMKGDEITIAGAFGLSF